MTSRNSKLGSQPVNHDSLPSCQHSQQQGNVINGDSLQSRMISSMDDGCHPKNSLLPNGLNHRHPHDEKLPGMSRGHPLNSNPISTGNPLLMSDGPEDEFSENMPPRRQIERDGADEAGIFLNGKLYVENRDRVIFRIKQWSDTGFESVDKNFGPCREQGQQERGLQKCAICRLKSPNGQENLYSNQAKDIHRHEVKGVLTSFGDCITLELYPEQRSHLDCNSHTIDPKANEMDPAKTSHPLPTAYQSALEPTHSEAQISNIVASTISLEKRPNTEQAPEDDPQGQSWWDEFDSQRAEPEQNPRPDSNGNIYHSCYKSTFMLNNPEKSLEQQVVNANDYYFEIEWKCDQCSIIFVSRREFEDHQCLPNSNVQAEQLAPIDQLSQVDTLVVVPDFSQNEINVVQNESINNQPQTGIQVSQEMQEADVGQVSQPSTSTASNEDKPLPEYKNNAKLKYPCPTCDEWFNLKRVLKQHLDAQHAAGNPFRCSKCNAQFSDEKLIKRHSCTLNVQTIKDKFRKQNNPSPGATNLTAEASEGDINTRSESGNRKRNIIRKSREITGPRQKSKAIGSGSKKRPSRGGSSQRKLKKPKLMVVKSKKPAESRTTRLKRKDEEVEDLEDDCDYETQTRLLTTSPKNKQKGKKKKDQKCNICGKCFTRSRRLETHKSSHKTETDRSSLCEKCGKKFARQDKLLRHMYVHSEEKVFACATCGKRFSRADKLSDHLKSHGTDQVHGCPLCEKTFLRPDILRQHVKLHRMGNKHQCPESSCLRFVTGKDRWAKHMARHEAAKAQGQSLHCSLCTKSFIQSQSLKAHFRKFHPGSQLLLLPQDTSTNPSSQSGSKSEDMKLQTRPSASTFPTKPKPRTYPCLYCSQPFARSVDLKKHMARKNSHPDDKHRNMDMTDTDSEPMGNIDYYMVNKGEESNPTSHIPLSQQIPDQSNSSILPPQAHIALAGMVTVSGNSSNLVSSIHPPLEPLEGGGEPGSTQQLGSNAIPLPINHQHQSNGVGMAGHPSGVMPSLHQSSYVIYYQPYHY